MASQGESSQLTYAERESEFYKYVQNRSIANAEQTESQETKEFYDLNARDYDSFVTKMSKVSHIIGSAELDKQLKEIKCSPDAKIAEVGAGTGMVGQVLKEQHGYTNITAFDISPGSLEEAKKKNAYSDFILCNFNEDNLEKYYQQFDHAISIGSFVVGNLDSHALERISSLVKPGGFVCISFREKNLESEGLRYKQKLEEMQARGIWKEISRVLEGYINNYNTQTSERTEQVKAYYIVFRVC